MFIVIEGIDGTGKSTLARGLAARLGASRTVLTREPTDRSPWGKRLRRSERDGRLPKAEELDYFHKDRLYHIEETIKPAIDAGKIVICDRYLGSTLAYQADTPEEAATLFDQMAPALLMPDLVLLLDCLVELALARINENREDQTSFEADATLRRAQLIYRSRIDEKTKLLDASLPQDVVLDAAWAALAERFPDLSTKTG